MKFIVLQSFKFLLMVAGCTICGLTWLQGQNAPAPSAPTISPLLAEESSHLQDYANSQIEWMPWGPEPFEKARRENKLVFLSISYFSCLWTAKMRRESYEDPTTAAYFNQNFVCVKLDRFQRPDLDRLYLFWLESQRRGSGWPMNLWLTPDRLPVMGVFYVENSETQENTLLKNAMFIQREWERDSSYWEKKAKKDFELFNSENKTLFANARKKSSSASTAQSWTLDDDSFHATKKALAIEFDFFNGGFGRTPKFFQPARLDALYHYIMRFGHNKSDTDESLQMITKTLEKMPLGGLRDHIGGGFFRYSYDDNWTRPSFEKSIFSQAGFARSYLAGWRLTGRDDFLRVAEETLGYAERDLLHPEGGFYSGEHAESSLRGDLPAAEGAYYTWTKTELDKIIPDSVRDVFNSVYSIRDSGNIPAGSDLFKEITGQNILFMTQPLAQVARSRNLSQANVEQQLKLAYQAMARARMERQRPALDRLITAQACGMMMSAFAQHGGSTGQLSYLNRARRAAEFIRNRLYSKEKKQLLRSFLDHTSPTLAYAEDYAAVIEGLIDLYEASGDLEWLQWAVDLQLSFNHGHFDPEEGGYFDAHIDQPDTLLPWKNMDDASSYSASALAMKNLVRLGILGGRVEFMEQAKKVGHLYHPSFLNNPGIYCAYFIAADFLRGPLPLIVIAPGRDQNLTTKTRAQILSLPHPRRLVVTLPLSDAERTWWQRALPTLTSIKPAETVEPSLYWLSDRQATPVLLDIAEISRRLKPSVN